MHNTIGNMQGIITVAVQPRTAHCLAWAVVAASAMWLLSSPAGAQEYREIRTYEKPDGTTVQIDEAAQSRNRTPINAILRDGSKGAADDQLFNEFYTYRVAEFTWPEKRAQLPELRDRLKKSDLRGNNAPMHERLTQFLFDQCSKIALSDEFHPVVRYNCMLMIGMLDATEPDIRGEGAVPFPASTALLLDSVTKTGLPDVVRIAAITGLERQAGFQLPSDARRNITAKLVEVMKPAAEGADPVAYQWMSHRAAQVLGKMAAKWTEANTPDAAKALGSLLGREDLTLLSRCDAAYALGNLRASAFNGAPVGDMVRSLGKLAVDVSQHEYSSAEHLKYLVYCVHLGLTGTGEADRGLRAAANGDAATFLGQLLPKVNEMVEIVNSSTSRISEADQITQVRSKGLALQEWLNGQGATAAAPATDVSR